MACILTSQHDAEHVLQAIDLALTWYSQAIDLDGQTDVAMSKEDTANAADISYTMQGLLLSVSFHSSDVPFVTGMTVTHAFSCQYYWAPVGLLVCIDEHAVLIDVCGLAQTYQTRLCSFGFP